MPSAILCRLKDETAGRHRVVEQLARADRILDHTLTLAQYSRLIVANYAIHQLIEPQLLPLFSPPWVDRLQLAQRSRLTALQYDLAQLNLNPPGFPQLTYLIQTIPQALGALYVLEGATLGGAVILKALQKNPHVNGVAPFHYYGLCGRNTRALWLGFCQTLNEWVDSSDVGDAIVAAAQETFDFYRRLLVAAPEEIRD
ncbi:MAG: biliverdin-producing heme oxygenase [Anaerolineae bacterium]|nr:biliverdin-producing heme oxygenase [Anaerolineae bacterium]